MNAHSALSLVVASLALAIPQAASAAAPPNAKLWNGTWHLNVAKSKWASAAKEQSESRTYSVSGDKITMKSSSKDLSGKPMNFSYSATWDGKWYPMPGNPNADRISLTAASERQINAKSTLHGKQAADSTATISADGKHLTLTRKMLRMKGSPTDVLEFDR
jgi:opacity protein-like surface antigen